jgi:simple sugar transport system ATP-binding protein
VPRVELVDVVKRFGTTLALDGARLDLEPGEVHALLGENGAGKTTLVRILYGLVRPDGGEIRIDGAPVDVPGPEQALARGIGLVHQHSVLVPALTVGENLFLGERSGAWVSRSSLARRARSVLQSHGLALDPLAHARDLSVAQQQRLEIVRALNRGVKVLVLDEPTAVLAPSEVEELLALMARLREAGHTIVFISHKLEEVTAVCDRVTVLRHGRTVATGPVPGLHAGDLARWMVGGDLPSPVRHETPEPGPPALRLSRLGAGMLRGIDLEVRAGEICAVAGIDGNGQTPLEEVLAGVRPLEEGSLEVLRPPLALIPGDRQRTGLVLGLALDENFALVEAARGGGHLFRRGWLRRERLRAETEGAIEHFEIQGTPADPVATLSGGNQQKLLIARALRTPPGVLVAVNPTRGLDVSATAFIRREIVDVVRRGTAVLLVSTDLDEVLELADRIGVLFRGRLTPVEPGRETRARVGELMLGRVA